MVHADRRRAISTTTASHRRPRRRSVFDRTGATERREKRKNCEVFFSFSVSVFVFFFFSPHNACLPYIRYARVSPSLFRVRGQVREEDAPALGAMDATTTILAERIRCSGDTAPLPNDYFIRDLDSESSERICWFHRDVFFFFFFFSSRRSVYQRTRP